MTITTNNIQTTIALDGLQLGACLVGMYAGGGNWLTGVCLFGAYQAGRRLLPRIPQTASGVVSEIWNRVVPGSRMDLQGSTEKIKNGIVGAAIGYTVGNLPFVSQVIDLGPITLGLLGGAGAYIYTDFQKQTPNRPVFQHFHGPQPVITAPRGPNIRTFNDLLTTGLAVPIDVTVGGETYEVDSISQAYDYLAHILGAEEAMYQAAHRAFWNNSNIVPNENDLRMMRDDAFPPTRENPYGLGSILLRAAANARRHSLR